MKRILSFIFPFVLVAAGIFMIVCGFDSKSNQENYLDAKAIISHIDIIEAASVDDSNDCFVYVKYTVDGKDYEEELGSYNASMHEGDEVDIVYNPENPAEIEAKGSVGVVAMFGFGAVLIILGAGIFMKKFR